MLNFIYINQHPKVELMRFHPNPPKKNNAQEKLFLAKLKEVHKNKPSLANEQPCHTKCKGTK